MYASCTSWNVDLETGNLTNCINNCFEREEGYVGRRLESLQISTHEKIHYSIRLVFPPTFFVFFKIPFRGLFCIEVGAKGREIPENSIVFGFRS